jgi:hypothetical protein
MNQDDGAASQMDRLEIVVDRDKGATSQSEHLENGPARVAPQINPNPEIDSDLRKRTVRKLDFNVLPIVTALCMYHHPQFDESRILIFQKIFVPSLIDQTLAMLKLPA